MRQGRLEAGHVIDTRSRRRLSPHFVVEEFDSRDGARVPDEHLDAIAKLVDWWLTPMRAEFGAVTVLSGYRSHAHNLRVGGARHSVHLLSTRLPNADPRFGAVAAAADVTCAEGSPRQWSSWAGHHRQAHAKLGPRGRGGIGTYITFLHLDTGDWRRWVN